MAGAAMRGRLRAFEVGCRWRVRVGVDRVFGRVREGLLAHGTAAGPATLGGNGGTADTGISLDANRPLLDTQICHGHEKKYPGTRTAPGLNAA